ncbi:HTH-type transcriptional regulator SgrR [Paenibacillus konkukensis]|uniref:HTH-type transcriptional regulator SgrR n=1 Tax=Paenibacillus konkukensis TaxID=2020716 RepID=A0ABY4RUY1_9BACL|nr:ABC transporter substrate-binding protein [Paenibacillus konkukensis]UQZ85184.1 HTH-type transcriptional regulator SgrR [Paenibacillus konkukensis]
MQLIEHYAELYRRWKPEKEREEVQVTVPAIAECLHCTERNAKLLIRAMRLNGWIAWHPGGGRGRSSRLRFIAELDGLLLEQAEALLAAGSIEEAAALLQSPLLTERGRERLRYAVSRFFGYHIHTGDSGRRHLLRFPSYRRPGMLDPAYATRRTELHLIRQLFDTLVAYDAQSGQFRPGLAHHWERDAAARRWRFYLQKHVRFHNGAPCESEDVRATLERLMPPERPGGSPYGRLYGLLERVEPVHEHLVEIRCRDSCYGLLSLLASTAASVVPRQLPVNWAFRPEGTGPFLIARRDDRVLELAANPDYFMRGTNLDRVEMWFLPEMYEKVPMTTLLSLSFFGHAPGLRTQGGFPLPQEHHGIADISGANRDASRLYPLYEAESEMGGMNFLHYRETGESAELTEAWSQVEQADRGCKYLAIQQRRSGPLTDSPALRSLLYDAVRQETGIRLLGGNRGELADRFVRSPLLAEYTAAEADCRAGDGGSASEAPSCNRAGWPRPECKLQLVTYAGAGNERDAEWLKQALAPHGVTVSIRLVPYERLASGEVLAEADLLLLEQPADADDEWALGSILGCRQSPLRSCLPEKTLRRLDSALGRLAAEPLRSERLLQLVRLERELLADRSVIVWYRWRQTASYPSELEGVKINAFGWVDYRQLWFRESGSGWSAEHRLTDAERSDPG